MNLWCRSVSIAAADIETLYQLGIVKNKYEERWFIDKEERSNDVNKFKSSFQKTFLI